MRQVPFLTGMTSVSEIRTMFAAEVRLARCKRRFLETYFITDSEIILQLILKSKTMYFAEGSIIADSHEAAKGLMVITSGFVNVELPMDSEEADEENRAENGKTQLFVFGRGYVDPPL